MSGDLRTAVRSTVMAFNGLWMIRVRADGTYVEQTFAGNSQLPMQKYGPMTEIEAVEFVAARQEAFAVACKRFRGECAALMDRDAPVGLVREMDVRSSSLLGDGEQP